MTAIVGHQDRLDGVDGKVRDEVAEAGSELGAEGRVDDVEQDLCRERRDREKAKRIERVKAKRRERKRTKEGIVSLSKSKIEEKI